MLRLRGTQPKTTKLCPMLKEVTGGVMDRTILMSVLLSFGVSVVLGPVVIPFLRRLKVGQTERDDGPKSHLKSRVRPQWEGFSY